MTSATELLAHLRSLDIRVAAEGDRLRVNAPKGGLTAEIREALRERKQEILEALRTAHGESQPPLAPRPRPAAIPLSSAQERLWVLDRFTPGSAAYNIPLAVRLRGPLDPARLSAALEAITWRHETLRTTVSSGPSGPVQIIGPPRPVSLPLIDLSDVGRAEQETVARRLVAQEVLAPFDLARGPLLRAQLLRLGAAEHVLALVGHHIIADGWSMALLLTELINAYEALRANRTAPLLDLPIQYADFALWEREWLQGAVLERQLVYWRERLRGPLPVLDLPTDFPRPPVYSHRGAREHMRMSASSGATMAALCRAESATPFMGLLATFAVLLHRLTGQPEVIIGAPVAGRDHLALEGLIGLFVNTVSLRIDCAGDPSFRELLRRVRTVCVEAYEHQRVPFEKVLQAIQVERDPSRTPVFQVFFNMLRLPHRIPSLADLTGEGFPIPEIGAKFDLTLYVDDSAEAPGFTAVYNADLFAPPRIQEMLVQLRELLRQVAATPDSPVGDYSLVTERARLALPDPTRAIQPKWYGSIPERLVAAAAQHPGRIAIEDADGRWSYGELDAGSEQLARTLRTGGIRAGDVVAILGHRSASLSLAILGVMRAGAVFVILDPGYPAARLAACVAAARPRGFLPLEAAGNVPRALEDALGDVAVRLVLPRTAAEAAALLGSAHHADLVAPGPDDPAYLTFTSGSTGEPQGILGTHRPVSHFLAWQARTFDLAEGDRFSLLSGLSHDPLLRDLFAPLWVGGTLCIPAPELLEAPRRLVDWLRQERVSVVHVTPAMSQLIGDAASPAAAEGEPILPALRWAFFGGDVLTPRHLAAMRRLAPKARCVNFYGATETPQAMGYAVFDGEIPGGERLPIGGGISDVQLLILTPRERLAGIGELAEICVRTPYLAVGYLDPSLTRERFRANPFRADPNDRIYHTGDLGRYRRDGVVEFTGRKDRQVKVRGFRIEPGEIEAALATHPGVRAAVVLPQRDGAGETCLVAYVTGEHDDALKAPDLRRHLAHVLPAPMVPAAFVPLRAFPLTPNGKVDHRALERLSGGRPVERRESEPPRDPLERRIAQIWAEILGCGSVGIDENFFDLGGHSLLAVRMIDMVEQACGTRLPVSTLFAGATIRHLAGALMKRNQETVSGLVAPIQDGGSRPPFFFLHGDLAGAGVYCRELARHIGPDQPFYALHPHGLDGGPVPLTIEEMADEYLRTLRTYRTAGPYLLGGFCNGGLVAFEMARRLQAQGERVDFLVVFDSRGGNARFRWLELLTKFLAAAFRLPLGDRRRIFLIARALTLAVERNLALLQSHPVVVLRKVRRLWRENQSAPRAVSSGNNNLFAAYGQAVFSYVPQRYEGRVALLLSMRAAEAGFDRDWRRVVKELEVHVVPGNHSTVITQHVQAVAACLRDCLDAAQEKHDAAGAKSKAAQPG